jgi:hypothetical protein
MTRDDTWDWILCEFPLSHGSDQRRSISTYIGPAGSERQGPYGGLRSGCGGTL